LIFIQKKTFKEILPFESMVKKHIYRFSDIDDGGVGLHPLPPNMSNMSDISSSVINPNNTNNNTNPKTKTSNNSNNYTTADEDEDEKCDMVTTRYLQNLNDEIHHHLTLQKNDITSHHRKHKWEKYKKMSNDFELIYSTNHLFPSISSYAPISRSYFKLWEILTDMETSICMMDDKSPKRCAFLADAPGGFVQATLNYRTRRAKEMSVHDQHFAISLKPTNSLIPHWKLTPKFCIENRVTLHSDTSGDLCDIHVVDAFTQYVGSGTCDFVTADGGFDFSVDFNNQESLSSQLIFAEILTILKIQAKGGSCVLKIYDIHHKTTLRALFILFTFFKDMYAYKPLSSRPANSEKYIIATGFKGLEETIRNVPQASSMLDALAIAVRTRCPESLNLPVPIGFLKSIVRFNMNYIANQIMSIGKTIMFIRQEKCQEDVLHTQLRKAIKWCHKYGIAINATSIQRYRDIFKTPPPPRIQRL
jgi:23S rRNA U2552 (ribose-2'-O)-methylase RlmE/FtsJ